MKESKIESLESQVAVLKKNYNMIFDELQREQDRCSELLSKLSKTEKVNKESSKNLLHEVKSRVESVFYEQEDSDYDLCKTIAFVIDSMIEEQ